MDRPTDDRLCGGIAIMRGEPRGEREAAVWRWRRKSEVRWGENRGLREMWLWEWEYRIRCQRASWVPCPLHCLRIVWLTKRNSVQTTRHVHALHYYYIQSPSIHHPQWLTLHKRTCQPWLYVDKIPQQYCSTWNDESGFLQARTCVVPRQDETWENTCLRRLQRSNKIHYINNNINERSISFSKTKDRVSETRQRARGKRDVLNSVCEYSDEWKWY